MQNRMSVRVVTANGQSFLGCVYANDAQAALVFARSWATMNGVGLHEIGFIEVFSNTGAFSNGVKTLIGK